VKTLSHKAKITGEEKKDNSVRIEFETTVDGEKINRPKLDGKKISGHFNIDYDKYKNNKRVDRHVRTWSKKKIQKLIEKNDPSESAEGREIEV